jgi:hypothetical protein
MDLKMHVHLPEADFGKLLIWRPKVVLFRYAEIFRFSYFELMFRKRSSSFVAFVTFGLVT